MEPFGFCDQQGNLFVIRIFATFFVPSDLSAAVAQKISAEEDAVVAEAE